MISWIKNRMGEVTSWNGTALIAVALIVLSHHHSQSGQHSQPYFMVHIQFGKLRTNA